MKSHNIIHITLGKANPSRQNGVNKVVYELAHHQRLNGHNSVVWGITKNPVVNYEERIFETRLFKDVAPKFHIARALKTAIKEAPNGVLFHLHGAFLPQLYAVARCLRKFRKSYIYTPHGAYNTVAMERSAFKKQLYISMFEKYIVRNARFIHIIGKSEERGIRAVFGREVRIRLIPNGQTFTHAFRTIAPITETVHFGFVGRLDIKTKGLDLLLTGFSQFVQHAPQNAQLHIVGDGPGLQSLKKLATQLHITSQVFFHGALFGEAKKELLNRMHFFCLTSRNEGLPGVVLEALASGLPCIVSKETNMGDYILSHNAGYCLRVNTTEEIATALTFASNAVSNNRQEYVEQHQNAMRLIQDKFDWSILSNHLIEASHAC